MAQVRRNFTRFPITKRRRFGVLAVCRDVFVRLPALLNLGMITCLLLHPKEPFCFQWCVLVPDGFCSFLPESPHLAVSLRRTTEPAKEGTQYG